jgi:hypothetical protein
MDMTGWRRWPIGPALATLGLIEVALILLPMAWLRGVAAWGLAAFVLFAATRARRATLLLAVPLALVAVGLALWRRSPELIERGLATALVFTAFLPAVQLLRAVAEVAPEVARARDRFSRLPARSAEAGFTLAAYALSVVLTVGSHALLAPLATADGADARRRIALAALRGAAIAPFWSPFFVGMAFMAHYLPGVPLWRTMLVGFVTATIGLALALFLFARARPRDVGPALIAILPLVPPVAGAAALLVAVAGLFGLSTLHAVILVMPAAALAHVRWCHPASVVPRVMRTAWAGLERMADEMVIVTVAMTAGVVLDATPGLVDAVRPLVAGLPAYAIVALGLGLLVGGGLIGAHPMVTGTIVLVAFAGAVDDLVLMQIGLIGWGLAAALSPSGITVMLAANFYGAPFQRLVYGRNLWFAGLLVALAVPWLTLVDRLARAG